MYSQQQRLFPGSGQTGKDDSISVYCKSKQCRVFQVPAKLSDTVGDLKSRISERLGNEVTKIFLEGNILDDAMTLRQCDVAHGTNICVITKPLAAHPAP